jgi:hypothetical protein
MISWPKELVSDIARRRCVLFIGAGISKNSTNDAKERPKDWVEFLTHLAEQITVDLEKTAVKDCIASSELLTACEIARKSLGSDRFKTELLQTFSEKRFRPAPIHDDLAKIDSRIVLTTNFDKLYDTAANALLHGDVLVKSYTDPEIGDVIRRKNRCIIKIHGTIDTPADIVLTRSDYASARNKYANFYRVIDALFMTHTFVFLGASMRDPDIALILEDYALRYRGTRPHYIVMPKDNTPDVVLTVFEESLNVKALKYDSANNHQELCESVSALLWVFRPIVTVDSGLS